MTSEDGDSLEEDELDEIVTRVVERLQDANAAEPTDEHEDDESGSTAVNRDEAVERAHEAAEAERERAREVADVERERAWEAADEARRRAGEAGRSAREEVGERADPRAGPGRSPGEPLENLGQHIERTVKASLTEAANEIERSLGPDRPSGVTIGPDDSPRKAVYKTQLQKGGRVAVPDAEIEALGLEPGDTLQVVCYPVE